MFEIKIKKIFTSILIYNKLDLVTLSIIVYLEDYDIAKTLNIRLPIIKNFYKKNNNNLNNENELKNAIQNWNKIEGIINDKKLKKNEKRR